MLIKSNFTVLTILNVLTLKDKAQLCH